MIFFIYSSFTPNSASNNRALAYLKAMSGLHFSVNVFFIMPDAQYSRVSEPLPEIQINYCWDKHYNKGRYIKYLSYIRYLFNIYRMVKPCDIVYLYGEADLLLLLSRKKGVHIFHERTEHPEVHKPKGLLFKPSLNTYLKICRRIDGIFVISTTLKKYFVDCGVPENKVKIVNSIVDISRFDGIEKQEWEPYFAYCGNGNNKKDKVDELIKAFAHVAARHNDIKLYIVGPTKQVYKDQTDNVQLVQELGLEDRVIFTGKKPAGEIPQLLVNARALFLTRPDTLQNRAGFSTKLGEYLASGNPVVAAGVGDIPLYLKNRENAFVFAPGDFKAVEEAMEYILMNPKEAEQVGVAGKMVAELYFNNFIETKKLIAAFKSSL